MTILVLFLIVAVLTLLITILGFQARATLIGTLGLIAFVLSAIGVFLNIGAA